MFRLSRIRFVVSCTHGQGDKALQECNLSTGPSLDCNRSIPPGLESVPPGFLFGMPMQAKASSEKLIITVERSELI